MESKLVEALEWIVERSNRGWEAVPTDVRKKAIDALAEHRFGWRPISEAPRDESDILVARFDNSTHQWEMRVVYSTTAYGVDYEWMTYSNTDCDDLFHSGYFTHFMPLPQPPEDKC